MDIEAEKEPGAGSARRRAMRSPICFGTRYPVNGNWYGSHIFAYSWDEARAIAAQRKLDEEIDGVLPSEVIEPKDINAKAHLACFLGFIALKAGKATPDDILGDNGILHEAIHLLCGDPSSNEQVVEDGLSRLKRIVPGYEPV